MTAHRGTTKGFKRTSKLLETRIRKASETRGFAQTRLLTHWAEVAGPEFAAISHPVNISYGRSGMGATLTLLTTGAQAPMLDMQKETLRDRVNAVYGFNAVARIVLTQTAATGFAEGQASFDHRPDKPAQGRVPPRDVQAKARQTTSDVANQDLREALEQLGQNILMASGPDTTPKTPSKG